VSGLLELLRPENLEQFKRDGLRVRILTKGGLAVELGPNQDPEDLARPPSLHGARLRRKVPLDSLTKSLRTELARVTRVLERRVERELRRSGILARLEADAAKREKRGPIGRGGIPLGPERELALERTFRLDGMEAVARLFADEETAFQLELESVLGDSYEEFFNRGGSAARVELGARGNFKLTNTAIADALKARANKLAGDIAEDVFDRLKTVIADQFYLEGRGIADVARALREEFDWLTKTRSDRIARTETLSVTEEAQHTVYKASGIHFKRWITTLDGKERQTHFEAHGQLRAIDEAFDVGDSTLMWPGDPDGPPEEICNCRCATQPIVTADQLFSDADIWRGDVDPDEFAKDREEPRDELTQGPSAPPPSDTEDLEFGDEEPPDEGAAEDEKRSPWAEVVEIRDPGRVVATIPASLANDPRLSQIEREPVLEMTTKDLVAIEKWLKAEREYERDDRGRFGTGGGGAKPGDEEETRSANFPTVRGLPDKVGRQVLLTEIAITKHDYESGAVWDKDGNRIGGVISQQNPTSVAWEPGMLEAARGGVLTHNHPGSSSFSKGDVQVASQFGLAEMRAVGNDGTVYRMTPAVGGIWPSKQMIGREVQKAVGEVDNEMRSAKAAGVITVDQANSEWNHLAWEKTAPKIGMVYTRDDSRRTPEAAARIPRIDREAYARAASEGREAAAAREAQFQRERREAYERLTQGEAVARAVAAQPSGAEASRARAAERARREREATTRPRAAAAEPSTERQAAIDRFRRQYGAQIRPRGTT